MTNTGSPPKPIDAATVILTRASSAPGVSWELYMVLRPGESAFAPAVWVFPGGKVDAADADPALARHCLGHPGPGDDPTAWRALRVCAVRELFEEVGVLLALPRSRAAASARNGTSIEAHRAEIRARAGAMADLAREEDLTYALDALHPIARWVTPEGSPRRFDTLFFVAELPKGQEPDPDPHETRGGRWVAPGMALELARAGEFQLMFPTERTLERLATHLSVEDLISSATAASLDPILPRFVRDGTEERIVLPGEPGYES